MNETDERFERLCVALRLVERESLGMTTVALRDKLRGNVDEGRSIADYYRGPYFIGCENCGALETADGVVCASCSAKFSSVTPEAAWQWPDVSDVARVLREMGARS